VDHQISHSFCFRSYGVVVRLDSNDESILADAVSVSRSALLNNLEPIDCRPDAQQLSLHLSPAGKCTIYQNDEEVGSDYIGSRLWKFFDSLVRIVVAEFAPDLVFLHAGSVGWRGKAMIMPGDSFSGKSTLVAELVKLGADYYSDEYAILDVNGKVHPFDRPISLRTSNGPGHEISLDPQDLGDSGKRVPLPLGAVLFLNFEPESVPNYEYLTTGQGVVQAVAQTIAIKRNSEFAIKVLKNAFSNAIIVKSPRPDVGEFAREFLEFIDNKGI
jgi:hypothetical protein